MFRSAVSSPRTRRDALLTGLRTRIDMPRVRPPEEEDLRPEGAALAAVGLLRLLAQRRSAVTDSRTATSAVAWQPLECPPLRYHDLSTKSSGSPMVRAPVLTVSRASAATSIEGVLERVTFASEENAWSVVKVLVAGKSDPVTAVGNLLTDLSHRRSPCRRRPPRAPRTARRPAAAPAAYERTGSADLTIGREAVRSTSPHRPAIPSNGDQQLPAPRPTRKRRCRRRHVAAS